MRYTINIALKHKYIRQTKLSPQFLHLSTFSTFDTKNNGTV